MDLFEKTITGFMVLVVLILILKGCDTTHTRLMKQCINDGNLEYKCEAILKDIK